MPQVVSSSGLITNTVLSIKKSIRKLTLLQKRIYKATLNNNYNTVHKLQKLLLSSESIKLVILLKVICNYTAHVKNQNLALNSEVQLNQLYVLNKIQLVESQPLLAGIDTLYLRKFLTDHIAITNLKYKFRSNLIYLCLQPEWSAKLSKVIINNTTSSNISGKINQALQVYYQHLHLKTYNKSNLSIYLLKIYIFNKIQIVNYQYLLSKLHTITDINNLLKDYYISIIKQKKNHKSKYLNFNSMSINLQYLLKTIIIEDIVSQLHVYNAKFINIKNADQKKLKLSSLIWHKDNCLFFSESKQEIILVQYLVTKSIDKIGLKYHSYDFAILDVVNGFHFAGFYIKPQFNCSNLFYKTVNIRPSFRSQLILLKKIKALLYHKDRFYRARANTYLSLSSATYKINFMITKWKSYYAQVKYMKLDSRIKKLIQEVLYSWQIRISSQQLRHIQTYKNYYSVNY